MPEADNPVIFWRAQPWRTNSRVNPEPLPAHSPSGRGEKRSLSWYGLTWDSYLSLRPDLLSILAMKTDHLSHEKTIGRESPEVLGCNQMMVGIGTLLTVVIARAKAPVKIP